MNEYMPLADVHRRALEMNGHKAGPAMDALTTAIRAEHGIRCYSKEIVILESSYCWVFQKQKMDILHNQLNDDDTNRREEEAYDIAYSISLKPKGVDVIRGTSETFVFTDFEKTEDGSSAPVKIRIWPNITPKISDDWTSLNFKATETIDIDFETKSRYWRNERLIILDAKNVICLRSDVDRCFPYSIANPTRGKPGRPSHKGTIFKYLDAQYVNKLDLPQTAKIAKEMMDSFAEDGTNLPGHSTCMKFIKEWRESQSGHQSQK